MPKIIHLLLKYKKVYICVIVVYVALFVCTAYTIASKAGFAMPSFPLRQASAEDASQQQTQLPVSFRGTKPNELSYGENLAPVFERLRRGESVRVLQVGDSHVRGNYLPNAVGSTLQRMLGSGSLEGVDMDVAPAIDGGITFDYIAKNGAHATYCLEPEIAEEICAFAPDLLIVSFGTNEAHGRFDGSMHQWTLRQIVETVRQRCPQTCFLFTTPPGSFITTYGHRWRDRRGRWHYNTSHGVNHRTAEVAQAIDTFARQEHHAVWNIFEIAGGSDHSASNWRNGGYMQSDCIHYTAAGYELQGCLLGEAIVKAYEQATNTP